MTTTTKRKKKKGFVYNSEASFKGNTSFHTPEYGFNVLTWLNPRAYNLKIVKARSALDYEPYIDNNVIPSVAKSIQTEKIVFKPYDALGFKEMKKTEEKKEEKKEENQSHDKPDSGSGNALVQLNFLPYKAATFETAKSNKKHDSNDASAILNNIISKPQPPLPPPKPIVFQSYAAANFKEIQTQSVSNNHSGVKPMVDLASYSGNGGGGAGGSSVLHNWDETEMFNEAIRISIAEQEMKVPPHKNAIIDFTDFKGNDDDFGAVSSSNIKELNDKDLELIYTDFNLSELVGAEKAGYYESATFAKLYLTTDDELARQKLSSAFPGGAGIPDETIIKGILSSLTEHGFNSDDTITMINKFFDRLYDRYGQSVYQRKVPSFIHEIIIKAPGAVFKKMDMVLYQGLLGAIATLSPENGNALANLLLIKLHENSNKDYADKLALTIGQSKYYHQSPGKSLADDIIARRMAEYSSAIIDYNAAEIERKKKQVIEEEEKKTATTTTTTTTTTIEIPKPQEESEVDQEEEEEEEEEEEQLEEESENQPLPQSEEDQEELKNSEEKDVEMKEAKRPKQKQKQQQSSQTLEKEQALSSENKDVEMSDAKKLEDVAEKDIRASIEAYPNEDPKKLLDYLYSKTDSTITKENINKVRQSLNNVVTSSNVTSGNTTQNYYITNSMINSDTNAFSQNLSNLIAKPDLTNTQKISEINNAITENYTDGGGGSGGASSEESVIQNIALLEKAKDN
ncbi:hypothetical protein RFI_13609 [Reticulomyxa filosa]|uniref:Uncharacterized protein n=1 Tax=Reticulomyxa filosa TaxID=46433 RepID=X6NDZ9_RETFI|nr:hypothetical protein RFI_13609 [Reticulomyxa filosa]|eukprot:ETO23572.1 hypothetical protein RFI_13609 [Reticulomyxa filosa]